jgi:hypothetical protein
MLTRLRISTFATIAAVLAGACSADHFDQDDEIVDSVEQPIGPCGPCFPGPCKIAYCGPEGVCEIEPMPEGTVCRGAMGICDLPDVCDGVSLTCPTGTARKAAGTVCGCDNDACTSDVCNGTSASCNHFQLPVGAPCGPGLACGANGCGPS